MAIEEPTLLPGLEDEVLLDGLAEMQILQTNTEWMIVYGPGMEHPLEPNLQKHQFTSNGADKRARTDFLSMFDYMARVHVPKPKDKHPKHVQIVGVAGCSEYRSMFDYMITKHRAEVKRRSRRVYERPSVIYKRGQPAAKAAAAKEGKRQLDPVAETINEVMDGDVTLRKSVKSDGVNTQDSTLMKDTEALASTGDGATSNSNATLEDNQET